MRPVVVKPWVEVDVFQAVFRNRALLGDILFDLNNRLPRNLARHQTSRLARNPDCFWYIPTFSLDPHALKFRRLHFVARDSDPVMLEVIWLVVVV